MQGLNIFNLKRKSETFYYEPKNWRCELTYDWREDYAIAGADYSYGKYFLMINGEYTYNMPFFIEEDKNDTSQSSVRYSKERISPTQRVPNRV